MLTFSGFRYSGLVFAAFLAVGFSICGGGSVRAEDAVPPDMLTLQNVPKENLPVAGEKDGMPFDIRKDAQKEAALSYGARGGLARRTYEIRLELERRSRYLDKVFNFGNLVIPAPSGLLIEPPVIAQADDAMIIEAGGLTAAVADRIYNIGHNAKIISAPRSWHNYLERSWGEVTPPPDILRPENAEERKRWIEWVAQGWAQGYAQADEIFQEDLNRLTADYNGMVRYRMLLAQGMVSAPFALQTDRGVTGGGNEMRVGDRAVQITGLSELKPGFEEWQPASR